MKNVTYINASAGSGKTYTLTHTLAELISDNKVKPEQVIMTTFTVKAASEMKEEAKKVLYEKGLFEEASRLDQAMIGLVLPGTVARHGCDGRRRYAVLYLAVAVRPADTRGIEDTACLL